MAVQTQGLAADASHLSQSLRGQMDGLITARTFYLHLMMAVFALFLLSVYLLIFRRIMKSIDTLRAGAGVIGSGNLDFSIEIKRQDEIGELSAAFNRMTG